MSQYSLSPGFQQALAQSDLEITRTTGRQLEWSGISVDIVMFLYTGLVIAFIANAFRINVYTPTMMSPWHNWQPYWRVFSPTWFSLAGIWFTYVLLFYRRSILLIVAAVIEVLFIAFYVVCFAYLIADWINCKNTFWCTCIIAYTTPNAWTNCSEGDGPSGVFLAHFWMLLFIIIFKIIVLVLMVWIQQSYSAILRANMNINPMRNLNAWPYMSISAPINEGGAAPATVERVSKAGFPPLSTKRMPTQQDV